jgi:DNA-binding MarR family transcriptional regulator
MIIKGHDMPDTSQRLSRVMPLIQHALSHLGVLSTESGRRFSLSNARMAVLSTVMHYKQIRMSDLAESLDLPRPLATRAVNELVDRGLLERSSDPDDRRSVIVRPSAQGCEVFDAVQRESAGALDTVLSRMTPEATEALVTGLEALLAAIHSPRDDT